MKIPLLCCIELPLPISGRCLQSYYPAVDGHVVVCLVAFVLHQFIYVTIYIFLMCIKIRHKTNQNLCAGIN
jgi:hypothetical protein